jgi:hypothetical protein
MQTFLPYPDLRLSVRCLDSKRLGKQRVEAKQILNILLNRTQTKGWRNHPTTLMWTGYANVLKIYFNECVQEWLRRGYVNRMPMEKISGKVVLPPWLGDERMHASHRSNLLRKEPDFYGKYEWKESPDLPYFWPHREGY